MVPPFDLESLVAVIDLFANILVHTCYRYGLLLIGRGTVSSRYEIPIVGVNIGWPARNEAFPDRLFFGVSSISYQSANDIKDLILWQELCESESGTYSSQHSYIHNTQSTSLYDRYNQYIRLARELKANMLEMPLCWSCLLPGGFDGAINEEIIDEYDDIINEMVKNNITPMIILFDGGTLPDPLKDFGGWTNPLMIDWFEEYARIAFAAFGNKVKYWVTFRDAVSFCLRTYDNDLGERVGTLGLAVYLCGHHLLLAHARVYHVYQEHFRWKQKGNVGVIQNFRWFEPENRNSFDDIMGVRVADEWYNAWLMSPLFHNVTDYPRNMKERIKFKSRYRNFPKSRLPTFTEEQMNEMKGAADFLGIDFHAAKRVRGLKIDANENPHFNRDADISIVSDVDQAESADITTWSRKLRKFLYRLNSGWNLPALFIIRTENKLSLKYNNGIAYHAQDVNMIRQLLREGAPIHGYFKWIIYDGGRVCSQATKN